MKIEPHGDGWRWTCNCGQYQDCWSEDLAHRWADAHAREYHRERG